VEADRARSQLNIKEQVYMRRAVANGKEMEQNILIVTKADKGNTLGIIEQDQYN
jgi:hypothetical protein